jgi:hypothetical protein
MNALANRLRPMKWGYAGDQAPLMGRSGVAHGIYALAVAVSNLSELPIYPLGKDVG